MRESSFYNAKYAETFRFFTIYIYPFTKNTNFFKLNALVLMCFVIRITKTLRKNHQFLNKFNEQNLTRWNGLDFVTYLYIKSQFLRYLFKVWKISSTCKNQGLFCIIFQRIFHKKKITTIF
jgi:hypothetical protein